MDLGDKIGLLIDLACKKKNKQIVELKDEITERLVEIFF